MYSIEIVLTMLLAVVASGYLVRIVPLALPMRLMQIATGAVIPGVFNHGVTLDPDIFFLVFLPPLLFLDGWRIPKDGLLRDGNAILQMARAKRAPGRVVARRLCARNQPGAGIVAIRVGLDLAAGECRHRTATRPRVDEPNWRLVAATSLAGVRGAITMAGVMTLPL